MKGHGRYRLPHGKILIISGCFGALVLGGFVITNKGGVGPSFTQTSAKQATGPTAAADNSAGQVVVMNSKVTSAKDPALRDGQVCPAKSFTFTVKDDVSSISGAYKYLSIGLDCQTQYLQTYFCIPAGTPPTEDIKTCAADPAQTPFSSFSEITQQTAAPGEYGAITATHNTLSMVMFYCAAGDRFTAPPTSATASCVPGI